MKTILWDVDTQKDFIETTGKLSVPKAESIRENLKKLTQIKAKHLGSLDAHRPNSPEFKNFPPHCIYGTPGQQKIPETLTPHPLYIPTTPLTPQQLQEVLDYPGQTLFEKQDIDIRTNSNAVRYLQLLKPSQAIIYGVVTEICVDQAIQFIAGDLKIPTIIVTDAIKEIDKTKAQQCQKDWTSLDVKPQTTKETIKQLT